MICMKTVIPCVFASFPALPLQDSPAALTKALRWTYITGGTLTLVMLILWPILALPAGVFSQGYFTMWIVVRATTI